jgi:hypothetical protein
VKSVQESGFLSKISFPELSECKLNNLLGHFCTFPLNRYPKDNSCQQAASYRRIEDWESLRNLLSSQSRFTPSSDLHFTCDISQHFGHNSRRAPSCISHGKSRSRFRFNDGRDCQNGVYQILRFGAATRLLLGLGDSSMSCPVEVKITAAYVRLIGLLRDFSGSMIGRSQSRTGSLWLEKVASLSS